MSEELEMRNLQSIKAGRQASSIFAVLVAVGSLLFFGGCRNALQSSGTGANNATTGSLSLTIDKQGVGRTILPEIEMSDFVEFYLEFVARSEHNADFSENWGDIFSGTVTVTVELNEGIWDLYVTAFLPGEDEHGQPTIVEAARGSTRDITVPSGETIAGSVVLFPIAEGRGTFGWDITIPASAVTARMEITRIDGAPYKTFYFRGGTPSIDYQDSIDLYAGKYNVIFTLFNGRGERAELRTILHVYQNMTSIFEETFTDQHFLVSLLGFVLNAWDGPLGQWNFAGAGITAEHFGLLGINGINEGNFNAIVAQFNPLTVGTYATVPGNLDELKALTDAALIGLAWTDIAAEYRRHRGVAENAIAGLIENGTPTYFYWRSDGIQVTVHVGVYRVVIDFENAIPLELTGMVRIDGFAWLGETLTANIEDLAGNGSPSFQWMRGDTEEVGTNSATYIVQAADMGQRITVIVTRAGYYGSIQSVPTAVVIDPVRPEGGTLADQLAWLREYASSNGNYVIEINENESITPSQAALPTGRSNLTIILRGIEGMRHIFLSSSGRLFDIPSGVTLELGENITLSGVSSNSYHLVRVNNGGTLVMNTGSVITGNANTHASSSVNRGGGVRVNTGGTFNMFGGEISGNVSSTSTWSWVGDGGGVFVAGGTFNMHGGTISNNHADGNGGGVRNEGTFRISDGIIHGSDAAEGYRNTAGSSGAALSNNGTAQFGTFDVAGFTRLGDLPTTNLTIHVVNGVLQGMDGELAEQLTWLREFAQSGGSYVIELRGDESIAPDQTALPTGRTNLTITLRGIGTMRTVNLSYSGRLFDIRSGVTLVLDENITLRGRQDNAHHLVRVVESGGTLIMNAGSMVTGNMNMNNSWCCCYGGGGVRIWNGGTFIMFGGEISGNVSGIWNGNGGGVWVNSGGTFNMRGGAISNNHADWDGGGVFNNGTFQISDGIIHGSDAADGYRNTLGSSGVALFNNGTAQSGTFSNGVFSANDTLSTANFSIHVVNGALQSSLPVRHVSAATDRTLAIMEDGTLWGWGNNADGQLGDGTTTDQSLPVRIGTAMNWASVSVGNAHTVAIRTDGSLWAWGDNGSGRLGDGTTTGRATPIRIGTATDWASVSAGGQHTVAIRTDGTLWAWGWNGWGQLGDSSWDTRWSPVQIGTATDWASVSAGHNHSTAIRTGGLLWAWGNNGQGRLGDGTTSTRWSPVPVR